MKRKMIFLSSGNSLTFNAVCNKYPEEIRKLREHYEIIPIDDLMDDLRKFYYYVNRLNDMDVVVKDLTMSAYASINKTGYVNKDYFPLKEGVNVYVMSGNIHNFRELFEYLYINIF